MDAAWISALVTASALFGGALFTSGALFARVKNLEGQVESLKRTIGHLEAKIDKLLMHSLRNAAES